MVRLVHVCVISGRTNSTEHLEWPEKSAAHYLLIRLRYSLCALGRSDHKSNPIFQCALHVSCWICIASQSTHVELLHLVMGCKPASVWVENIFNLTQSNLAMDLWCIYSNVMFQVALAFRVIYRRQFPNEFI